MLIGEHHGYYVCSVEMLEPGGKCYAYIRDVSSSFGDTLRRQVNRKNLLLTEIATTFDEAHRNQFPVYTLQGEAEQYILKYDTDRYEIMLRIMTTLKAVLRNTEMTQRTLDEQKLPSQSCCTLDNKNDDPILMSMDYPKIPEYLLTEPRVTKISEDLEKKNRSNSSEKI